MKESKSNPKRRCLEKICGHDIKNSNNKTPAQRRREIEEVINSVHIANLPWDITCNIMSMLPIKSLIRFMCASKRWSFLKLDPYFVNLQLNNALRQQPKYILTQTLQDQRSSETLLRFGTETLAGFGAVRDFFLVDKELKGIDIIPVASELQGKEVKIIASCNGLLCLLRVRNNDILGPFIIYNPVIGDSTTMEFPVSISDTWYNQYKRNYGFSFGFDVKTQKYKVVIIGPSDKSMGVHVISVGESYWRSLNMSDKFHFIEPKNCGFFFNGVFYWIIGRCLPNEKHILAMDISTEKFEEIDFINECSQFQIPHYRLLKLQKSLAVIVYKFDNPIVDVWKLEDSKTGTWSRQSTHNIYSFLPLRYRLEGYKCRVEGIIGDSDIVLEYSRIILSGRKKPKRRRYLARYTPDNGGFELKFLNSIKGLPQHFHAVSLVPSLLSPVL